MEIEKSLMKLIMKKAKRETVATYISGVAMFIMLLNCGYYIYLPFSKIIAAGRILSFSDLYPRNQIFNPALWVLLCILLFLLSIKLKMGSSYASILYEKLGPGSLLLILLLAFWIIPPIITHLTYIFFKI